MATYNGHKNYNHWNVSLWIFNDEGLYNLGKECRRKTATLHEAAERFISIVADPEIGGKGKTPDGAPWSMSAVKAALSDILD